MSRFWVIFGAAALVAYATVIFLGGLASGRWAWGLIFAVSIVIIVVDWLRLRGSDQPAATVADRMIAGTMVIALGLVLSASRYIEVWLASE
jgi:hypothetical protein